MNLHQEKFQSIQDFRDQYLVMKRYATYQNYISAGVKVKKNMTNPTDAQLSKTMDNIKEELHAIIFMYKENRHK